ncbi:MAG: nucleotide exchange factor GrpE [Alphaproteobacteria bacterium]|nr:nucleotide exchange factor GrpE [Alphaproteobacteria bacterium]
MSQNAPPPSDNSNADATMTANSHRASPADATPPNPAQDDAGHTNAGDTNAGDTNAGDTNAGDTNAGHRGQYDETYDANDMHNAAASTKIEQLDPSDFEFLVNSDGDDSPSPKLGRGKGGGSLNDSATDGEMLQAAAGKMQEQQARIDALSLEVTALKADKLQTLADMENLRQRERREIEKATKFGVNRLAKDLLPVADNLNRAIDSARSSQTPDDRQSLINGIDLVGRELLKVFDGHGIRRISPQGGEPFNVDVHQVVGTTPNPSMPANSIVHVAQEGFMLHDRLLRPAMVICSTVPEGSAEQAPPSSASSSHGQESNASATVNTVV